MVSTFSDCQISAIKSILGREGIYINADKSALSALIQACRRRNDEVCIRLPTHRKLLQVIVDKIRSHFMYSGQIYLAKLYRAIALTGYYGLLRIGELTSGTHPILACDTHLGVNRDKIKLVLRSSETHGKGNNPQITTEDEAEFDRIFNRYIVHTKHWSPISTSVAIPETVEDRYLFSVTNHQWHPSTLRVLKGAIHQIGLESQYYDTHSLRIGRCCDLFRSGMPVQDIKQVGRWVSSAIYKYLKE